MSHKNKEGFSSLIGFLLTIIGFAVGVGSLWRFPYVCGSNGGFLFILTYILVILVIGIPLLTAEISIGFATQKTAINAYKELAPDKKWYYAGYLHILVGMLIVSYTAPVYAWILAYIYRTSSGFFTGMDAEGILNSFLALGGDYKQMFLFAIINWILVAGAVMAGLQKGVEKLNKLILPLLALIMLACIFIGLRVEGAEKGIEFLMMPNVESFGFHSVTAAVGQAFFAIGIGMVASMVFGSYIKNKSENIVRSSTVICTAILVAGLAAGFMIFPMVFAFGLEPSAGGGLTLITLPNVFNNIAGGNAVGALFFIGFYLAAYSSAIGLLEAVVAVVMDTFDMVRRKAVVVTMIGVLIVGSCAIVIPGFFDNVDFYTSNYLLVISGLLISIFVGWIWGIDNFVKAANVKSKTVALWLKISVKYICPIAITIIFLGNFISF